MNKNRNAMGSVGALSAMDSRMEMLETYRESIDDEMVIHQSIHVYGKAVMGSNCPGEIYLSII
ncbi:hypothetical protein [Faecalicoccus pleomorphus]|nr:hypothetical protein [Faecalicoccus pleomorphus]